MTDTIILSKDAVLTMAIEAVRKSNLAEGALCTSLLSYLTAAIRASAAVVSTQGADDQAETIAELTRQLSLAAAVERDLRAKIEAYKGESGIAATSSRLLNAAFAAQEQSQADLASANARIVGLEFAIATLQADRPPAVDPVPSAPVPIQPTQRERVLMAWTDGHKTPVEIAKATGILMSSVYACMTKLRNSGDIPAAHAEPRSPEGEPTLQADQNTEVGEAVRLTAAPLPQADGGSSLSPSATPLNLAIDFDEGEVEGPNGKSILLSRAVLDIIDTLRSGQPVHLSKIQSETGIPSRKIKDRLAVYPGQLSRVGLEITFSGDFATMSSLVD